MSNEITVSVYCRASLTLSSFPSWRGESSSGLVLKESCPCHPLTLPLCLFVSLSLFSVFGSLSLTLGLKLLLWSSPSPLLVDNNVTAQAAACSAEAESVVSPIDPQLPRIFAAQFFKRKPAPCAEAAFQSWIGRGARGKPDRGCFRLDRLLHGDKRASDAHSPSPKLPRRSCFHFWWGFLRIRARELHHCLQKMPPSKTSCSQLKTFLPFCSSS